MVILAGLCKTMEAIIADPEHESRAAYHAQLNVAIATTEKMKRTLAVYLP